MVSDATAGPATFPASQSNFAPSSEACTVNSWMMEGGLSVSTITSSLRILRTGSGMPPMAAHSRRMRSPSVAKPLDPVRVTEEGGSVKEIVIKS